MEAIRYTEKVTTDALVIPNLGKFLGQSVEIIILPIESPPERQEPEPVKRVSGLLHKYANPELIKEEKKAWAQEMRRKHAIR